MGNWTSNKYVNLLLGKFSKCTVDVKNFYYLKPIVQIFIVRQCGLILSKQRRKSDTKENCM